jgi:hypothetical protein
MEEVQAKLPDIFPEIESDMRDKDWMEIRTDFEKLNWLRNTEIVPISANYIEMADMFAQSLLQAPDKYSILQLTPVTYFINSLVFQCRNKSEKKQICDLAKDYCTRLNFFKSAREKLNVKHENIEEVVEKIDEIYKETSGILMVLIMHVAKKYESINKKDFTTYLNELFHHDVLMTAQYSNKTSYIIRNIVSQYEKKPVYSMQNKIFAKSTTSLYYGEISDKKLRNGFGRLSLENGDKYEGYWENDLMHGEGLYIWKKNGWYRGMFNRGEITGKGVRHYNDDSVYEGNFLRGRKHEYGKMKFKNGDLYEGTWSNDAMTGEGTYTWAKTSDVYKGKFRYDTNTSGILTLSTGEEVKISN